MLPKLLINIVGKSFINVVYPTKAMSREKELVVFVTFYKISEILSANKDNCDVYHVLIIANKQFIYLEL